MNPIFVRSKLLNQITRKMIGAIVWDFHPEIIPSLGESIGFSPRWYGILFAMGFVVGYQLMQKMLANDKKPDSWMDSLLLYTMIGTVLGARLGHVFFYDWAYYSKHLDEILMVWKGGLASHGAAIGIITAMFLWSRKVSKTSVLWILDRVVVTVALAGCFIRLGNFFNSEIIGKATDLPWAVVFKRVDMIARHPSQIYESMAYLLIFLFLYSSYWKRGKGANEGYLFGMFLILIFGFRFFVEFSKEVQVAFENSLPLNMGQLLSIPLVLAGAYFVVRSQKKHGQAS